jgi:hypothetical protein
VQVGGYVVVEVGGASVVVALRAYAVVEVSAYPFALQLEVRETNWLARFSSNPKGLLS